VDETGLSRLLDLIEKEGEEIEKRIGQSRGLFRENILQVGQGFNETEN